MKFPETIQVRPRACAINRFALRSGTFPAVNGVAAYV
jgi:hypothetical protein